MKKVIIIEEENNYNNQKKVISNKFIEWLLYMIGYAIVLIIVSTFIKSFYINNKYYGLYALLASIIIYILNQTVKPVIFYITLPITAITMGLFYPIINVFILKITSFILGSNNFNTGGIGVSFIVAILISFFNLFMEGLVIKPIIYKRRNRNE